MTPWLASPKAMEKIPAESGPWVRGVSETCQVRPRSGEWKTRAARPPVANQMLGSFSSGAEAPPFSEGLRDAGSAWGMVVTASAVRTPCEAADAEEMTE